MKKINRLKLIARTNKKFGNIIVFRKLKVNYLSQKANVEHSNRFADEEKSMIISHYHDRFLFFILFFLGGYKLCSFCTVLSAFYVLLKLSNNNVVVHCKLV